MPVCEDVCEDGNKQITFTSRSDIARYVSYVLAHLLPDQLKDRSFTITGDKKVTPHGSVVMSD